MEIQTEQLQNECEYYDCPFCTKAKRHGGLLMICCADDHEWCAGYKRKQMTMNARQFFEKVALLRETQKEYFRTRSHDALRKSKALEREIDEEIDRVNRLLNLPEYKQPETPNLFNQ